MKAAMKLGGYFMAHAIWSVSGGDLLIPLVGYEKHGRLKLIRLIDPGPEGAVAQGRRWLDENPKQADRAAFVHDGVLSVEESSRPALYMRIVVYEEPVRGVELVVPYRAAADGFAVHRLRFLAGIGVDQSEWEELGVDFYTGVDAHETGARIWKTHRDDTI